MLCYDGRVSLLGFLGTSIPIISAIFTDKFINGQRRLNGAILTLPALYVLAINILIRLVYKGNSYQIALRAALLSSVFSYGVLLRFHGPDTLHSFGMYMCVLSFFHYSEFLFMAIIQPKLVTLRSFVINHSWQYTVAAIMSWMEFLIEVYFFPFLKVNPWISHTGLVMCLVGESMRKAAMLTAGSNFNHVVQTEKAADHVLVTSGIYSLFRHPSYVGWFYWSIGTQVLLLNPICTVVYTILSWKFFSERVLVEEMMLLNFFGEQYFRYQEKVGTGLPFIPGYRM